MKICLWVSNQTKLSPLLSKKLRRIVRTLGWTTQIQKEEGSSREEPWPPARIPATNRRWRSSEMGEMIRRRGSSLPAHRGLSVRLLRRGLGHGVEVVGLVAEVLEELELP